MASDSDKKQKKNKKAAAKSRPPTSQDVAKLANVSRATVSYVLNDVQDSRISEETKERVLKAAAQIGYVPNQFASSLRSGQTNLVFIPYFDWPYNQNSMEFLQMLSRQMTELGYTVMLQYFKGKDTSKNVRYLSSFHPVGVLFSEKFSQEDVDILTKNGVRALLAYGDVALPSTYKIDIDFTSVGKIAAHHFIEIGRKRIAVILPKDNRITYIGTQRLDGIKSVGEPVGFEIECVEMDYDYQNALALAKKWKSGVHPNGVFTYNDEYGMLLMTALQDVGFSIPDEIALVGCDNLPVSELARPQLTTIEISNPRLVEAVSSYFHDLIQQKDVKDKSIAPIAPRLIKRESS